MLSPVLLLGFFAASLRRAGAPLLHGSEAWETIWSDSSEAALLAEIEKALGLDFRLRVSQRLPGIEAALEGIFNSLPKNQHGRLGRGAVRYVLRRLLLSRHAWVLGGLESAGDSSQNSSWLSRVLVQEVSQSNTTFLSDEGQHESDCWIVQQLFERSMNKLGADLAELGVLTAAIEQSVHSDLRGKLKVAYEVRQVPLEGLVGTKKAEELIDLTLMSFVRGRNISSWSPDLVAELEETILSIYPPWAQFQPVMREVQKQLAPGSGEFNFEDNAMVVKELGERFGDWNNKECQADKLALLGLEEGHSGRVRLLDYYKAAVFDGKYQFSENMNYLRQTGLLDESNPMVPRVIVSNYIVSPSNCMARTGFYSVCCRDECEDLLGHVEKAIAAPLAEVSEVVAVVRGLPSATVPANRTLTVWLLRRLDTIAQTHKGKVPLHGRLFAQWLHFVYPNECSLSRPSGLSPTSMIMEQWEEETGQKASATEEELQQYIHDLSRKAQLHKIFRTRKRKTKTAIIEGLQDARRNDGEEPTLWSDEEELYVPYDEHHSDL